MRVQLLPFGVLKDSLIPATLELPQHATVADLLAALCVKLSANADAARLLSRIAVSVNAEYAQADRPLQEGDLVGLLPPVSGGSTATRLTREPIPAGEMIAAAKQGSDGAVVVFDGIVRDNTRGRCTLYLDYEAYEEMAERQMESLIAEALGRFAIREATIVHRLGRIEIGETSVLILISSAHRAAAFDACRWLIDTLKKTVPIWKKEVFVDGAVWADGEPFPAELIPDAVISEHTP